MYPNVSLCISVYPNVSKWPRSRDRAACFPAAELYAVVLIPHLCMCCPCAFIWALVLNSGSQRRRGVDQTEETRGVPSRDCWGCRARRRPAWPRGRPRLCRGTGRSTPCTPPPPGAAGPAARSNLQSWWNPGCDSSRNPEETAPPGTETQERAPELRYSITYTSPT